MKIKLFALILAAGMVIAGGCSGTQKDASADALQKTEISWFLGHWTIDIEGGSVGWLDVRQEDGFLDGDVLWGGGSVLPVSNMFLAKDYLLMIQRSSNIIRKRDDNKNALKSQTVTSWMEIVRDGEKLNGILLTPARNGMRLDTTTFTGTRLPEVGPAPDKSAVKYGEPLTLFNGR